MLFKHRITGIIVDRPAHYNGHPIIGLNLIPLEEVPVPQENEKKKSKNKGYKPDAIDGDKDGLVQDGTAFERLSETPTENIDNEELNTDGN